MGLKMLVLSLTGDCNLACSYCYADKQARCTMSWETARCAIDLAAIGDAPFILQFSGGEPLLASSLLQRITSYVQENRLNVRMDLQTNGTLLTDELAAFLYASDVGIGISLDGRPSVHDKARSYPDGSGSAAAVAAGIECLANRGIGIGLTCVVTAKNVHHLADVIDMAYYFGNVRRLGFDLLRAQGRGISSLLPKADDVTLAFYEVFSRQSKLERLTGRLLFLSQVEHIKSLAGRSDVGFSHCHAMNGEGVHVAADGSIYACSSLVGDARFFLGTVESGVDVRRQKEISAKMRQSMFFCMRCPDFAACGGGCFARWLGTAQKGACVAECALKRAFLAAVLGKGKM